MKSTNYTRGSEDNFHLLILFQAGSEFPSDLASRLSPSPTPVKQLARSRPSENFLLEENPRLKEAHSSEGRQTAALEAREGGWVEAGEHQKADAGATRVIRELSEIGEILETGFADGFRTKTKRQADLGSWTPGKQAQKRGLRGLESLPLHRAASGSTPSAPQPAKKACAQALGARDPKDTLQDPLGKQKR